MSRKRARRGAGSSTPSMDLEEVNTGEVARLLRLGRDAEDAYDLDGARDWYQQAFELAAGRSEEAIALLCFLVESMAAYDDALRLEEQLSIEAKKHPEVCSLLGLAAAHSGDSERARKYLASGAGRRAAEGFVVLARHALNAREPEEAQRLLVQARQVDPSQPEVVTLLAEAERQRASARRPMEEAVERAANEGNDELTALAARELLARWPGSSVGRRVLWEVEARRKRAEARALVVAAEEVVEQGEFARAVALLRQAEALGAESLEERIQTVQRLDAGQRERERVRSVLQALAAGTSERALVAYLGLEEHLRAEVCVNSAFPELGWLDELRPVLGERDTRGLVSAVLALARAVASEPEEALRVLAPHEAVLDGLPQGRMCLEEARRAVAERKHSVAQQALAEARAAFEQRQYERAGLLLTQVDEQALIGPERDELAQLGARLTRWRVDERRLAQFNEKMSRGAVFEALEVVREALADADECERDAWRERRIEVVRKSREVLRLHVTDCASASMSESASWYNFETWRSLHPSGERLFLGRSFGRWIFLRVYDLRERRVVQLVRLYAPEPLGLVQLQVDEGSLWLVADSGAILELAIPSWEPLRWLTATKLCKEGERVDGALLVPGSRFLWLVAEDMTTRHLSLRVFDLARSRTQRVLGRGAFPSYVPGSAPQVLVNDLELAGRVHASHGAVVQVLSTPGILRVVELAASPSGEGWVALVALDDDGGPMSLALLDPRSGCVSREELVDSSNEAPHAFATSREACMAYVMYSGTDGEWWLMGARISSASVELRFRTRVSNYAVLVSDIYALRVVLVAPTRRGEPVVVMLGDSAPDIEPDELQGAMPRGDALLMLCGRHPRSRDSSSLAKHAKEMRTESERARFVQSLLDKRGVTLGDVLSLAAALREVRLEGAAELAERWALERFGRQPALQAHHAEWQAMAGAWADVAATLSHVDAESLEALEPEARMHVYHLNGVALLRAGRLEEAQTVFLRGSAVPGRCDLEGWGELAAALLKPRRSPRGDGSRVRFLVESILAADEQLACDQPVRAREMLDNSEVWAERECQSFARLAHATLLAGSADEVERFHEELILAAYIAVYEETGRSRRELPLVERAWPEAKLADVAKRAGDWLKKGA